MFNYINTLSGKYNILIDQIYTGNINFHEKILERIFSVMAV